MSSWSGGDGRPGDQFPDALARLEILNGSSSNAASSLGTLLGACRTRRHVHEVLFGHNARVAKSDIERLPTLDPHQRWPQADRSVRSGRTAKILVRFFGHPQDGLTRLPGSAPLGGQAAERCLEVSVDRYQPVCLDDVQHLRYWAGRTEDRRMAELSWFQQSSHARRGHHAQPGQIDQYRQAARKRIKRIIEPGHRARHEIPANDDDPTAIPNTGHNRQLTINPAQKKRSPPTHHGLSPPVQDESHPYRAGTGWPPPSTFP